MSSIEPIRRRKAAASAAWHCAAHELQQQIKESRLISITTSTKKQWLTSAPAFLATKYASLWHDLLEASTTPPAPPSAPSRTGLRPRPNAPLPPPARALAPKDFVREVVSMLVDDALHIGQVMSYDASLRQWQIDFPTRSATPTNFGADDMARYGPPNTTCPPQPGTSEHTIAAYIRGRAPGPAWFASAPMISPDRRRLWAGRSFLPTAQRLHHMGGPPGVLVHGGNPDAYPKRHSTCLLRVRILYDHPLLAAAQKWCRETGTPPGKAESRAR
jgi:hypothetical protein